MKSIIFSLCLLVSIAAQAQSSSKIAKLLAIVAKQDSIDRAVFLDEKSLPGMSLLNTNTRRVWSGDRHSKKLVQLFDIRLKFENQEAALAFHRNYQKENAEYGPEIKKHKLKCPGALEFKVFGGEKHIQSLAKEVGVQMFCYLFVVDNYFVKVYLSCNIANKPKDFEGLMLEIIRRIKGGE